MNSKEEIAAQQAARTAPQGPQRNQQPPQAPAQPVQPKDEGPIPPLVSGVTAQPSTKENPIDDKVSGLQPRADILAAEHGAPGQPVAHPSKLSDPKVTKVRVQAIMPVQYEGLTYEAGAQIEVDEATAKQWTSSIEGMPQHYGTRSDQESQVTRAQHIRAKYI